MASARKVRVAINGFGRIGRAAFKIALQNKKIEIVAINDLTSAATLAHLLQYDTVYGKYPRKVGVRGTSLVVDRGVYPIIAEPDPAKLPWKKYKVDVVLECTGRFVKDGAAMAHIKAGAQKVVVSAPTKGGGVETFLFGVNAEHYRDQKIISNASCTTNCIAPVAQIMHSVFGVEKAMMTTIHSYTAEQNLVDGPPPGGKSGDLRRARAAAANIIPTTTGAAISTTEVIPELKGLFDGLSLRVPTFCGSLADFTFVVKKPVTVEKVNKALITASKSPRMKGVLTCTSEPIVSSDIIGNPHSSIVDLSLTQVVDGTMVKVVAWYDNEFGYSNRLVEMISRVMK
jgi:glyceraldehyde 3-phosphate dehydrogenase